MQKAATERRKTEGWQPPARKRYPEYASKTRLRGIARRLQYKLVAFNGYGGALCACCGESTLAFLSLDHIDGNGNSLRRAGEPSGDKLYRKLALARFPPGYQVLCMNCNWGKRHDGICPHRR